MISNIDNVNLILISLTSALLMYLGIILANVKLKFFFGICVSNEKTSLYHVPIIRGLGILYIIALIPMFFTNELLNASEITLLIISTLFGFYDDKYGITQIKKILFLTLLISLVYLISTHDENLSFFDFFLNIILFLFLTLFFNQIDGINGLAGSTFCITCIGSSLLLNYSPFVQVIIPVVLVVLVYLNINFRGNVGIQGESGSFFMGALIYIIMQKFNHYFDWIFVLAFLFPVLSDVISTTLVRLIYVKNLLIPHRKHLYQRLVEKYKSHIKVTFLFSILQIISVLFILYIHNLSYFEFKLIFLVFLISIFLIINLRYSYFIHKGKF